MKIVLLDNVKKLGKKGEVVEVADGYARNVVIPKKLGVEATATNLNNLKLKNKNEEKKEENLRNLALKNKEVIEKLVIELKIKAGENGKTFGSITNKEIAEGIEKESKIVVDRKDVMLEEPIKSIGKYDVKVKLHKDIIATVKVSVVEE